MPLSRQESLPRSMRRNNIATVKVEEKRLQKLLDFIDTRCQHQRSQLKRQIEDTQHVADETEDQKHKAAIQLLKGYFQLSSGRVPGPSNAHHDERMLGVLSEPSFLPTVPEVDPDILAAPRSMYDRITKTLDTSKLPYLAPKQQAVISQPSSVRSDESTPTPRNSPDPWSDRRYDRPSVKADTSYRHQNGYNHHAQKDYHAESTQGRKADKGDVTPTNAEDETADVVKPIAHSASKNGITPKHHVNGFAYTYHSGVSSHAQRPSSRVDMVIGTEMTPRLIERATPISRSRSLRSTSRHSKAMSLSTVSLTDMNQTRKQRAAEKLRTALKTIRVPR